MNKNTPLILVVVILICISIGVLYVTYPKHADAPDQVKTTITTFDECVRAGYPVMESYPRQCRASDQTFVEIISKENDTTTTPDTPPQDSPSAQFEKQVTLQLLSSTVFPDGLTILLSEINDSRCPPDVQCVWAGEISCALTLSGGDFNLAQDSVRLGTVQTQTVIRNGYTFSLVDATPDSAIIVVTKKSIDGSGLNVQTGTVNGHITIGPFCPVERIDHSCTVPPEAYTSRSVVVYASDAVSVVKRVPLDMQGKYAMQLPTGTYWIQIEPAGIGVGEKKKVNVITDTTSIIDFDIDTGIR